VAYSDVRLASADWHTSSCIALGYLLVRGSTSALEGTLPSLRFPPLARYPFAKQFGIGYRPNISRKKRLNRCRIRIKPSSLSQFSRRFDLRFFRPLRADLSIRKSSSFFPPLIAATSQRGLTPRPAQVSPDGPRYFGGTFFPFKVLPPSRPPTTVMALPILSNCRSMSARRLR